MFATALNHMTVARLPFDALLEAAAALGCAGIEVRDDLGRPLFDGADPVAAGARARRRGLRILAVAEVKRFDDWTDDRRADAVALIRLARAAGAEAVSLIPSNDANGPGPGTRTRRLHAALSELKVMLEDHGLVGLVEPLGFRTCTLRSKSDAVEAIEAAGAAGRIRLVHDTFHHFIAGGGPSFPEHTGMVHVSGVVDRVPQADALQDRHRVLVGEGDRLGNVAQVAALRQHGYSGPVSIEAFAPDIHALADPVPEIARSFAYIRAQVADCASTG